jgi:hypothetical protein
LDDVRRNEERLARKRPESWDPAKSRRHGIRGKKLENHEKKEITKEKLTLVLHRTA